MRTDLSVRAIHKGDMRVDVQVREHVLHVDYPAVPGKNPSPLELLLASLTACAASTLNVVLSRKLGAPVRSLQVEARAERRQEHPTGLTAIELVYHLDGEEVEPEVIERAIHMAEDQLGPVLDMLRPGTKIASTWDMDCLHVAAVRKTR
jgi:uncharacterized OsmC-like protein